MKTIILEQTDMWQFESHSNGAAYTLYRKSDMAERFVQYGDDATMWRENYDTMVKFHATPGNTWFYSTWNDCLQYLWECAGGDY